VQEDAFFSLGDGTLVMSPGRGRGSQPWSWMRFLQLIVVLGLGLASGAIRCATHKALRCWRSLISQEDFPFHSPVLSRLYAREDLSALYILPSFLPSSLPSDPV
jgi:hypothetical protein